MARHASQHPTELELEIFKILWRDGPCSSRQIRDRLAPVRNLADTSVQTMMNIMTRKEYVSRKKDGGVFKYQPHRTHAQTSGAMMMDMIQRIFDGSVAAAVQCLLEAGELQGEQLVEVKKLIDKKVKEEK